MSNNDDKKEKPQVSAVIVVADYTNTPTWHGADTLDDVPTNSVPPIASTWSFSPSAGSSEEQIRDGLGLGGGEPSPKLGFWHCPGNGRQVDVRPMPNGNRVFRFRLANQPSVFLLTADGKRIAQSGVQIELAVMPQDWSAVSRDIVGVGLEYSAASTGYSRDNYAAVFRDVVVAVEMRAGVPVGLAVGLRATCSGYESADSGLTARMFTASPYPAPLVTRLDRFTSRAEGTIRCMAAAFNRLGADYSNIRVLTDFVEPTKAQDAYYTPLPSALRLENNFTAARVEEAIMQAMDATAPNGVVYVCMGLDAADGYYFTQDYASVVARPPSDSPDHTAWPSWHVNGVVRATATSDLSRTCMLSRRALSLRLFSALGPNQRLMCISEHADAVADLGEVDGAVVVKRSRNFPLRTVGMFAETSSRTTRSSSRMGRLYQTDPIAVTSSVQDGDNGLLGGSSNGWDMYDVALTANYYQNPTKYLQSGNVREYVESNSGEWIYYPRVARSMNVPLYRDLVTTSPVYTTPAAALFYAYITSGRFSNFLSTSLPVPSYFERGTAWQTPNLNVSRYLRGSWAELVDDMYAFSMGGNRIDSVAVSSFRRRYSYWNRMPVVGVPEIDGFGGTPLSVFVPFLIRDRLSRLLAMFTSSSRKLPSPK